MHNIIGLASMKVQVEGSNCVWYFAEQVSQLKVQSFSCTGSKLQHIKVVN